jgi:TolB-like protein
MAAVLAAFLGCVGLAPAAAKEPTPGLAAAPGIDSVASTSRPTLWLLAIGVSHYKDPGLRLDFAEADARAIAEALTTQGSGPLYNESKVRLLLNDEVTRESILSGMQGFLGQAGPDDVAVIFIAGHGVRERSSGSYYFLPYTATAGNLITDGLRMSDFDEMMRILRRNVRRVVVLLDTCHAGALQLSSRAAFAADDLAGQVSISDGLFLLAATKPDEESKERPELEHGAFTYAVLKGLQGAADSDGDGLLSVSDLFSYVARSVPRLTEGRQHPYHKMEGTDLTFAAVNANAKLTLAQAPPAPPDPEESAPPRIPNSIAVAQFRNLRDDPEHDWIGRALRVALNTELSKVSALRVYAPEVLDLAAERRHQDHVRTAQQLGIATVVTGSFHVVGDSLRVDAIIVNTATGLQEGSDSVEGDLKDVLKLQKTLVLNMLQRLPVDVSPAEGQSIREKTNSNVNAYRLLMEAEGMSDSRTPTPGKVAPRRAPAPHSQLELPRTRSWTARLSVVLRSSLAVLHLWTAAYAGEVEDEVRALLEEYRSAHVAKDLDRLAAVYVAFPPHQREATNAYLQNAIDLAVEITDVEIESHDDKLTVSFLRRDRFTDAETSEPTTIEIRVTKILVLDQGKWKLASVR